MQADGPQEMITLGIDIGGTTTKLGIFKKGGVMLARHVFPTGKAEDGGVLEVIVEKLRGIIERGSISAKDIAGVGFGVPGPVTRDGFVLDCPNIDLDQVDIAERFLALMPELDVPVRAGNDANAAALGEMFRGSGRGHRDLVMVTLGTGVGAGIVANGEILTGLNGMAGEIGHIMVNEKETTPCGCGRHGCLEQYTSGPGIVRAAQEMLKEHPEIPSPLRAFAGGGAEEDLTLPVGVVPPAMTARDVFDAAHNGCVIADLVVTRACVMLGKALAFLADCTAPEIIILGGGVSRAGALLLDRVRGSYERYVYPGLVDTPIRLASLGGDAGVTGCDYLIEHFLYETE